MPKNVNQNRAFVEQEYFMFSILFFLVKKMLEIARMMPPIGHNAARKYPYSPVNMVDWKKQIDKNIKNQII
jgi:hypothetical protein